MPLTFNARELAAMESGMQRIGVFFRLETDPVVRLWLGVGKIEPGINAYDLTAGAQYDGFGAIQDVPAFNQLINGKAARVEFSVSGVSGRVLQIASGGDAAQVRGKRLAVGFALMGEDWAPLGGVHWHANYTADFLAIHQQVTDDPLAPVVRTVTLSVGTLLTGRRRPGLAFFSDQDQQARFLGDRFCERTPSYGNGFNKPWPIFPPPP